MPSDSVSCACGDELGKMGKGDMEACPSCGRIIVKSDDGVYAHQGGRVSLEKAEAKITVWCPDCREKREKWDVARRVKDHSRPQRAMFSQQEQRYLNELESDGVINSEKQEIDDGQSPTRTYTHYEFVGGEIPEVDETINEYWEGDDIPETCQCDECGCSIDVGI